MGQESQQSENVFWDPSSCTKKRLEGLDESTEVGGMKRRKQDDVELDPDSWPRMLGTPFEKKDFKLSVRVESCRLLCFM